MGVLPFKVEGMQLWGREESSGGIFRGPLPPDQVRTSILVCMLSVAIYQAVIVILKVFATFKRRGTLYFWSLLAASAGVISHSTGIILKWFVGSVPWQVNTAFASFGWWGMVTGQSLVLYSRLHLVCRNERLLKALLAVIIFDFVVFQVVTTVMTFGSNQDHPGNWLKVYGVYERIQLCVFTLQESVISLIYIKNAFRVLQPSDPEDTRHTKKYLIYLNVLCIVLDIAFVAEVFSGEWVYKTGTQSLAYGTKITIEFVVLNKLMDIVKYGPSNQHNRSYQLSSGARQQIAEVEEASPGRIFPRMFCGLGKRSHRQTPDVERPGYPRMVSSTVGKFKEDEVSFARVASCSSPADSKEKIQGIERTVTLNTTSEPKYSARF